MTAFAAVRQEITEALARFEPAEPESARLLRLLVDHLADRGGDDLRAAELLMETARRLSSLEDRLTRLLADAEQPGRPEPHRYNVGWTGGR